MIEYTAAAEPVDPPIYCDCPCLDCIEGQHCGLVGEYFDAAEQAQGNSLNVRCDYPADNDDLEWDDEDYEGDEYGEYDDN